ncbi:DUF1731 domain-containing protein [Photobacterium sp. CAU 1568]|uniref:DUF1731 domain-containing protein n=1 Tax=Photobacterium arenosum TaxID=2774143 RepID=A0ABR9BLZ7_9GAMM|nr:DUF1731 domain-containing protein [Photobacterium arenosum]MBD8513595.1 DUF1731 domain-containing protein [Photobacterium arenosum]
MKQTVLITGANSFVARHLISKLESNYTIKLLTRMPRASNEYEWNLENWTINEKALDDVDYIVHLSGSKLNDGTPLTPERQQLVRETRIGAADFLRKKLKERNQKLTGFVSASAIGYYGYTDKTMEIDENGEPGTDFDAQLCIDWEAAADEFKTDGMADHVSKIRVSLVLGKDGGIFPIFESAVSANPQLALQSSPDAFPWNHVDDMAGIFAFAVQHNLDGVYNSVAPQPASSQDIYKAIANTKAGKNHAIDSFHGQHLVSHKIVNAGYEFKYPNIEQAVKNILQK